MLVLQFQGMRMENKYTTNEILEMLPVNAMRPSPEALFASLFVGNLFMLLVGMLGNKLWVKLIAAPKAILLPIIIAIAFVGSYAVKNSMFDVYICLGFGVLGWLLRRNGFPTAPLVLAMILGRMAETNFRQALLSEGTWTIFITNPLSLGLLVLAVISLVWPIVQGRRKKKKSTAEE